MLLKPHQIKRQFSCDLSSVDILASTPGNMGVHRILSSLVHLIPGPLIEGLDICDIPKS